jgi:hypothetical protein
MHSKTLAALALCATIAALPAGARQFSSSGTITGANGRTYQHQGSTTTAPGYYNHQGSVTGPNGQTGTRDVTTSYGAGSYDRTVTSTGPNGQTASHSSTGTYSYTP